MLDFIQHGVLRTSMTLETVRGDVDARDNHESCVMPPCMGFAIHELSLHDALLCGCGTPLLICRSFPQCPTKIMCSRENTFQSVSSATAFQTQLKSRLVFSFFFCVIATMIALKAGQAYESLSEVI